MCTIIFIIRDVNKNKTHIYLDCFSSIKTSLITNLYLNLNNNVCCFVTYEGIVQGETVFFYLVGFLFNTEL